MFRRLRDKFLNIVNSRLIVVFLVFCGLGAALIVRVFNLQIVNGQSYLEDFLLKTEKTREIASTRGNIFDCNGVLLAYSELAYSVKLEDVYEAGRTRNAKLNATIYRLIKIIESNGDNVISDFNITLNANNEYEYTLTNETQLLRFKADVYGEKYVDDLSYEKQTASAQEMIEYLAGTTRYAIGEYKDPDNRKDFQIGQGYTRKELLQMVTIRYAMGLTSYQKYLGTTIASDVSDKTVAVIMENQSELDGVSIEEDTARRYVDSKYFASIIGYTGKISTDELESLNLENKEMNNIDTDRYSLNDVVGKTGIEQYMELELQGVKGTETVFVDNMGKVIEVSDRKEPTAGNDTYLTIDADLQIAAYNILEQNIAGILVNKIQNIKDFTITENTSSGDIIIPIYDVYFALFNNNVIDTSHFTQSNAGENEKLIYQKFLEYKQQTFAKLEEEIVTNKTPYNKLSPEYQVYESNIVSYLLERGVLDDSVIDTKDSTYIAWKTDETIGLGEYLEYAVSKNWISVSKLDLTSQYSDSEEIFSKLTEYIIELLDSNAEFNKKLYKYMLKSDTITGRQVCMALCEQGIVDIDPDDEARLYDGSITAYEFMVNRIKTLEITPAQLALDPFSGSMVITDVNNGNVLALVSYPGYDNNRMANTVDAAYYNSLQVDKSKPMYNYATQQETAPGSTFKMVSATAGLGEGIIDTSSKITCLGIFDKMNSNSRCWIYTSTHGGTHGPLNVSDAIKNSCNYFFYEVGYRLSMEGDTFNSELGLSKLAKYADMYGLSEKTGIEIVEEDPRVSDELPILSAIGQGTNNYTTVGLARYVTTVANSGTCYNLTLLDKLTDHNGNVLEEYNAEIRNTIDMPTSNWNAIHSGMRRVVEAKSYYSDLAVNVAGKTGTAQESKSRANHALFVCYAPYENPQIAIATRIAFGYSSDYAARTTKDIIKYKFGLADKEELIDGTAEELDTGIISNEW